MQFLRLFSTVCAVCCMFVYEDTKEKDKEKGEVGNNKEIVNESVSKSSELDELRKLWGEYYSIVDDLCDKFNLRVSKMEFDTIVSEVEEMKIWVMKNFGNPDDQNGILSIEHSEDIPDIEEPKLLTSLESLELLFEVTFNEIKYSIKIQEIIKLVQDQRDKVDKSLGYVQSRKALMKLEDSILSKLKSLDKKWDNIDLNERLEKSFHLEKMILKRTKKYNIFVQRYNVLTHRQKVLYEILLQEGLKNFLGGNTIYDVHRILRQKIQKSTYVRARNRVPRKKKGIWRSLPCIQR